MRAILSIRRFFFAAVLFAVPTTTFGIGRLNTDFALPAGLANDVVRIRSMTGSGNYLGTGTVIGTAPDGSGGNFLCILTADHVVRDPTNGNSATMLSIGFRFDQNFNFTSNIAASPQLLRRDMPVDLAVFAVDVPANQAMNVPALLQPVPIIAPNTAAGNQIVQAGYGDQATAGTGFPAAVGQDRYAVNPGFGTYIAAYNTATGTTANLVGTAIGNGNNYQNDSLDGTFAFTKDAMGNFLTGTSYILSGDSGGPTFESNGMGGLGLVGVHSWSIARFNPAGSNMNEFEIPGDQWHDVNASSYAAFITQACAAVPEPGAMGVLVIGILSMLRVRQRNAATL